MNGPFHSQVASRGYGVPAAPPVYGPVRWVAPDESVQVAGHVIQGGMIYVGAYAGPSPHRAAAAVINASSLVASYGNCTLPRHFWCGYGDLTPDGRAAYLTWLAGGRSQPDCDVSLIAVFLAGLEYRVVVEGFADPSTRVQWSAIERELQRLESLYGHSSNAMFGAHIRQLLEFIQIERMATDERLYTGDTWKRRKNTASMMPLRLALGQAARDRVSLSPSLAFAWALRHEGVRLGYLYHRLPNEFERAFLHYYAQIHGPGILLNKNRKPLTYAYSPLCSRLYRPAELSRAFESIPDVSTQRAAVAQLQVVVNQCGLALARYMRAVTRSPDARHTIHAWIELPGAFWPASAIERALALRQRVSIAPETLTIDEVIDTFGANARLTLAPQKVRALALAMEVHGIGIEPHIAADARVPGQAKAVVLFALPVGAQFQDTAVYRTCLLTVRLACLVLASATDAGPHRFWLVKKIASWRHLTPVQRLRLSAHVQWLGVTPIRLSQIKDQLSLVDQGMRDELASFAASISQVDGVIPSATTIAVLEDVYKVLGADRMQMYSDVHSGVERVAPTSVSANAPPMHLDPARIARLQADSLTVGALLADIFQDDQGMPSTPDRASAEPSATDGSLFGLDTTHSQLVRLLLSRARWSRAELIEATAPFGVLLDGALERINDAALELHDMPLIEGDANLEINSEVAENLTT